MGWGVTVLTVALLIAVVLASGCADVSFGSKKIGDFGNTKEEQKAIQFAKDKYGDPLTNSGPPRFLEPMVATGLVNNTPVNKVTKFSKDTGSIFFWVFYDNFKNGDQLTLTWTFNGKTVITLQREAGGDFGRAFGEFLKPDKGWAVGTHTITINGGGTSVTATFEIIDGQTQTVPLPYAKESYNVDEIPAPINAGRQSPLLDSGDIARTGDYGLVADNDSSIPALLWKYDTGADITSSPAVANGIVYIGVNDGNLYALDATTGDIKWKYLIDNGDFLKNQLMIWPGPPAVVNGIVYAGGMRSPGESSEVDYLVYALDATTGGLKWKYKTKNRLDSSLAVVNGIVYVGCYGGYGYALDANTGTLKWESKLLQINKDHPYIEITSPAVANGIVYFGILDHENLDYYVYALDATTGDVKWKYLTSEMEGSSPKVANGIVYVRGFGVIAVYALDATTGVLKWKYTNLVGKGASPAIANGIVYFGSGQGLFALDATTGALKWIKSDEEPLVGYAMGLSSPTVANGIVYIGGAYSSLGYIYAFDATTGDIKWKYKTGGGVWSSPAVANGIVYFGSLDNYVYAIRAPSSTTVTGLANPSVYVKQISV